MHVYFVLVCFLFYIMVKGRCIQLQLHILHPRGIESVYLPASFARSADWMECSLRDD